MKEASEDPMKSFKKYVKSPRNKLEIKEINMSDLRKIYKKINNSNSVSLDNISMKTLSKIKEATQPIILNLINSVIKTGIFPKILKTARIIPIKKVVTLIGLNQGLIDQITY